MASNSFVSGGVTFFTPQLGSVNEVVFIDKNRALGTCGSILLGFISVTKRFEAAE